MKHLYEIEVSFEHPERLKGQNRTITCLVEAGTPKTALCLGSRCAAKDLLPGGYVPKVAAVREVGEIDARG